MKLLDPIKRGKYLRKNLVKNGDVLVVDFSDTLEGKDTSKIIDLMQESEEGKYVFRAKVNLKEFDPIWREQQGLPAFDFSDENEIRRVVRQDFDAPTWFLKPGETLSDIQKYNRPFIFQVKGCNFATGALISGCQFCFVDNKSNDGRVSGGFYLSAANTVLSFNRYSKEHNLNVIRVSGGEPTLVLDHMLVLLELMQEEIPEVQVQLDTNLSTGTLIEYFEAEGIFPKNVLEKIAEYPVKVLAAFKGTDDYSIMDNVQAACTLEMQIASLRRMIDAGLDVYPELYNPDPVTIPFFLDELGKVFSGEQLDAVILRLNVEPLKVYGPTKERLAKLCEGTGRDPEKYIKLREHEWNTNYQQSVEIMDKIIRERYSVGYREILRPEIEIKVR